MDYLYRYTSLESLALTLKNHTIRFNPLDKMDDLQEKKTKDLKSIGQFFFISSWTEEEKEDIPMWKLYTNMKTGVRIKLPKNPFKYQGTNKSDLERILGSCANTNSVERANTFLDLSELFKHKVYSPQAWSGEILFPVEYTDDVALLEPQVKYSDSFRKELITKNIGRYKNTYWKFQKEWRYLITFYPCDLLSLSPAEIYTTFSETANRIAEDIQPPPFDHYNLEISDDSFSSMEITPSPQMSSGFRLMLDDLVGKYNPSAKIVESKLANLI